jgi:hypothetical protein
LFDVDKYVQEDIDMNEPKTVLAALDAIYDLIDPASGKLIRNFDTENGEHVISLEYRYKEPLDSGPCQAERERQAQSVLQYLLAST